VPVTNGERDAARRAIAALDEFRREAKRQFLSDAIRSSGSATQPCPECKNKGHVVRRADGGGATDGEFAYETPCPSCSGSAAQNHWRDLYWETLAEVERLRSSGSAAQNHEAPAYGPKGRWTQLRTERDEARAEVTRLRAKSVARSPQDEDHEAARRAAHEAAQDWVDAAGGDEVDTGGVVDAALDAYRSRLHSSGSAAQNQEDAKMFARIAAHEAFDAATASERVTVGEAINAVSDAAVAAYLARSPQDEDHEESDDR
jgi:hypothetical protein